MQPSVSVIVPNYNHARFLKQRIDTILNQTYTDFELIILDDCSTDDSKKIIDLYAENEKVSHVVYNEENSGSLFNQWQKGLALAQGEWIWIAESDDYSAPNFLETLMSKISDGVSLVFCKSNIVDEDGVYVSDSSVWLSDIAGQMLENDFVAEGKTLFYEVHAYKNIVSNTSSAIFRKKIVDNVQFPYNYKICGDWLFFAQMTLAGNVAYVAETLNYWRQHSKTTRNVGSLETERLRLQENMGIVRHFSSLAKKLSCRLDYSKHNWLIDGWLRQFTYKNLLKLEYVNPPMPYKLKLKFHCRLIQRFLVELCKSFKKRLFK